jgi:two-component system phosphate regulon sensor histidine kinase PhoR
MITISAASGLVLLAAVVLLSWIFAGAGLEGGIALAAGVFGWRPSGPAKPGAADSAGPDAPGPASSDLYEIVHALDIAAIVLDAERKIAVFNRHAADLFPSIAVGAPMGLATRNPDLMVSIDRSIAERRSETAEFTERMLQGRRFIVTSTPLSGPRLLLQFRDTSEQERLAQLRADFIANASHELRTPLASIKGFIETLLGPARNDEAARTRFLGIMATQAQRMNRILDDLLSLSRIEMRAHLRPEGPVDMNDLIAQVIRGLEPLAQQADITLTFTPFPTAGLVRGDRDELEQVMQNLIHNAIKYGRPAGTVAVTIRERAPGGGKRGALEIAVTDDGPGIAPEHLPRLTERFYRVDTARSREQGGTGLGLAIVKHILNRHRGELDITSEVGRGSRFAVVLESMTT